MTFQVPQFLDLEDKIVGPLTLKQFGFIAAAFLLVTGSFYVLQFWLWVIISVGLVAIAVSLAFVKIAGRPLFILLFNALVFYWQPRRYIWQHEIPAPVKVSSPEIKEIQIPEAPPTKKTRRVAIPKVEVRKQPTVTVTKKPEMAPSSITTGQGLKRLEEKMLTTTRAIPKREKAFAWLRRSQEQYETLRKFTGERIRAKRVDYR